MPSFKTNVKQLKSLIDTAVPANRNTIRKVAQLYEEKRIPNFRTALTTVVKLAVPSLYKKGDANASYDKVVAQYETAEPIIGRLGSIRGMLR